MLMFPKIGKVPKNKHRHISNKRIAEWTPCFVCTMERGENYARGAYAMHEVFHNGSAYMRNLSIQYNAQIPVCMDCDERIHRSDGILDRYLKEVFQERIMYDYNLSMDEWIKIFYKSYL